MTSVPQKVVKGKVLANFLAAHPVSETSKLHTDIPDEVIQASMTSEDDVWQMIFDGASRISPTSKIITGVGVVFVSPENHVLSRVFSLAEPCFNNITKYYIFSLASSSLSKWGYNILKLMVTIN